MRQLASLLVLLVASQLAAPQGPSPALLVLNKQDNTMVIVDPSIRTVVGRVPTGEGPHEVAASADGKLAFVANYGSRDAGNTLSVIDIAARKELRRVDLGALRRPHGIQFKGGQLYFTAEANKAVGRYDPSSGRVDVLAETKQDGTHMLVLSQDGSRIFTANIGSDSVSVLERSDSSAWKVTTIPVGKGPEGIDISPNGKEVWTAHSRDGGISIIGVAAGKVIQTIDIGTKRSNRLKFTPDGRLVLVSDLEAGELAILDARTHKPVKRLKLGPYTEGILVRPDGAQAYVAVAGDNRVAILDLKTLEVSAHIETGAGPDGMAWVEVR
jgi:YVTN family beta-propeller protein